MACVTSLAARWPLRGLHDVRAALEVAWADPARGYHDTRHLAEVLDRLDELADAGTDFDRVEVALAAWFHDGVYDARPGDEERSAQWAERALAGSPCAVAEVARLVRLTEQHRVGPGDHNGAALCDADLAVLASPPERYAEYAADVRREWAHVSDGDFAVGRLAVLESLAAKEHLFETAHGREAWEPAARTNLSAEMVTLREAARAAAPLVDPPADPSVDAARPPAGGPPARER
jgi:predicted metal-dependent HD superfamily phosphohydrolase